MADSPYQRFLADHRLPVGYLDSAAQHFTPIVDDVVERRRTQRPVIVGINGSQGSGKTTLADYLVTALRADHGLNVVSISIDDFYLTRAERRALSQSVHPLFATRGVPGTHDIALAMETVQALRAAEGVVTIPRFDKSTDDRFVKAHWDTATLPVDVIILEGWCFGVPPQSVDQLRDPINLLEEEEDTDGAWRGYINDRLVLEYADFFAQVDVWAMLKAPSFDCVFEWRLEQEEKLAKKLQRENKTAYPSGLMNATQMARFIQFYQRLTEHALDTLPDRVQHLFILDATRRIDHAVHQASGTQS